MFDKVVLLSEGCPIYHGKASDAQAYFESIGFSSPVTVNPADLLLDLANGKLFQSISTVDQVSIRKNSKKLVEKIGNMDHF